MYCGKCGSEIPEENEYCSNCGAKLGNESIQSNSNAEIIGTVKKAIKINKKILIPFASAVIILAAAICAFFVFHNREPEDGHFTSAGYFEDLPWGSYCDTVYQTLEKIGVVTSISEKKDNVSTNIDNYCGIKGLTALVFCMLDEDGKLEKITIGFTTDDDCKYSDDEIALELKLKFDKVFGKSESSKGEYSWETESSSVYLTTEFFSPCFFCSAAKE